MKHNRSAFRYFQLPAFQEPIIHIRLVIQRDIATAGNAIIFGARAREAKVANTFSKSDALVASLSR